MLWDPTQIRPVTTRINWTKLVCVCPKPKILSPQTRVAKLGKVSSPSAPASSHLASSSSPIRSHRRRPLCRRSFDRNRSSSIYSILQIMLYFKFQIAQLGSQKINSFIFIFFDFTHDSCFIYC